MLQAYLVTKVPGTKRQHALILQYPSLKKAVMDHAALNRTYEVGSAAVLRTKDKYWLVCPKTFQPERYAKIANASRSQNPKKAILNAIPLLDANLETVIKTKTDGASSYYHHHILRLLGAKIPKPSTLTGKCTNIMLATTKK